MPKKLADKKRKEILAVRYQEVKPKSSGRKKTFKELWDDDKVWEEH